MICPICHDTFSSEQSMVLIKHATDNDIQQSRLRGHYFHTACLTQWMHLGKGGCPLDRDPIRTLYRTNYYESGNVTGSYRSLLQDIKITNYMLDQYFTDINSIDDEGKSLAYYACHWGHDDLVAKLLKRGANFHLADNNGFTPLMAAVSNNHYHIVSRLLKNKKVQSRINQRDFRGKNIFDYACSHLCFTIICDLLDTKLIDVHQVHQNITDYWDTFNSGKMYGLEILDLLFAYTKLQNSTRTETIITGRRSLDSSDI